MCAAWILCELSMFSDISLLLSRREVISALDARTLLVYQALDQFVQHRRQAP